MYRITLARLGGIALLAAAVLAFSPLSPGKDAAQAADPMWTPGHFIDLASYLLLLLGLPAVAGSVHDRLGILGVIGYTAFVARTALSIGSQLYEARVVPVLAQHPELAAPLRGDGALNSIYGPSSLWLNILLAAGGGVFGVALWRAAPQTRWMALMIAVGSAAAAIIPPLGIVLFTVGFGWLGLRLTTHGTITVPVRTPRQTQSEPRSVDMVAHPATSEPRNT